MTSLFTAFDPSGLFGLSLNWASAALVVFVFPAPSLFNAPSRAASAWGLSTSALSAEFGTGLGPTNKPGSTWFLLSFFVFLALNNGLGLFPYVFTAPSHLSFALALAFPLWVGHMAYSCACQPDYVFAHLVPKGTPGALLSFMILVELVSSGIRPLTLSIRLMANLTAGHLLLCLLSSNLGSTLFSAPALGVLAGLTLLVVLEVAVALIQAYVFTLLSALYLGEAQTPALLRWQTSMGEYVKLQI